MSKKSKRIAWVGSMATAAAALTMALPAASMTAAYAASSKQTLDVFSYWTAGGEAQGLAALIKMFNKQYPGVHVVRSIVAGGAGSNAQAVLATRLQAGSPPDSFQTHPGSELMAYVDAGYMKPLNSLYKSQGWTKVMPKQLIDMVTKNGNMYSVPVNVHRGNVLWYNAKLFKKYNLQAPTTFAIFFHDADVLKSHGITALSLADKDTWEANDLWEDTLLGTIGPKKFDALWAGKLSFTDAGVVKATQTFKRMLGYINSNHAALQWQDASQMVATGKAGMNVMGDWAKGYFTTGLGLKPKIDFGWTPTPGTLSDFVVISDTFGIPKQAKDPQQAIDWLKLVGSKAGQDAFNPLKGSIPARTDANHAKYDVYSQQAMKDFTKDSLVPSFAHGLATNPAFLNAQQQAMTVFVTARNVDNFLKAVQSAAQQNNLGQ